MLNEKTITNFSFICLENGKTSMPKNMPTVVDIDNNQYVLVSAITPAYRNIVSAHALRIGDEIECGRLAPCYSITWEKPEEEENFDINDFEDIQDLNTGYDILKGTI